MIRQTNNGKTKLFLAIGLIGLFAVLTGFSTTFLIPLSKGTFKAPTIIYIHGFFSFSWICLFIIQSLLIQNNKFKQHRLLGILGVFIAIGITVTIVPAGLYQIEKELRQGLGQTAISNALGIITSPLLFISVVIAGILKRNDHSSHKRLMLLATILLLWPAWFRFRHIFPSVPNPEIWFAIVLSDFLIIISFIWDKMTNGKINPTLLYVGLFIIIEHIVEAYMFDNYLWRELANEIYGILT
jgi:magnesium-transporting ATPase (P-type)